MPVETIQIPREGLINNLDNELDINEYASEYVKKYYEEVRKSVESNPFHFLFLIIYLIIMTFAKRWFGETSFIVLAFESNWNEALDEIKNL
jgi:hypothetical protein